MNVQGRRILSKLINTDVQIYIAIDFDRAGLSQLNGDEINTIEIEYAILCTRIELDIELSWSRFEYCSSTMMRVEIVDTPHPTCPRLHHPVFHRRQSYLRLFYLYIQHLTSYLQLQLTNSSPQFTNNHVRQNHHRHRRLQRYLPPLSSNKNTH